MLHRFWAMIKLFKGFCEEVPDNVLNIQSCFVLKTNKIFSVTLQHIGKHAYLTESMIGLVILDFYFFHIQTIFFSFDFLYLNI